MKNLRFIPKIHPQPPILKAGFEYDRELIADLKSQKRTDPGNTLSFLGYPTSITAEIFTHTTKKGFEDLKHSWEGLNKIERSTVHADLGSIVEQINNITEINTLIRCVYSLIVMQHKKNA